MPEPASVFEFKEVIRSKTGVELSQRNLPVEPQLGKARGSGSRVRILQSTTVRQGSSAEACPPEFEREPSDPGSLKQREVTK